MGNTEARELNRNTGVTASQPVFLSKLSNPSLATYLATTEHNKSGTKELYENIWAVLGDGLPQESQKRENETASFLKDALTKLPKPETLDKVVESIHPYENNMNVMYEAVFVGATELTLTFDAQCKTETNCDKLFLFLGPDKTRPYTIPGFGEFLTGTTWPRDPVTIPTDRVYFNFTSDGSNVDWGFKVTVTGPRPKPPAEKEAKVEVNSEDAVIRSFVRVVTTLLRAQVRTDPELFDDVLNDFSDILSQATPGALSTLSGTMDTSMSQFQAFLRSCLAPATAGNVEAVAAAHGVTPEAAAERARRITVLLASLSIARGSQLDCLSMLRQLTLPNANLSKLPITSYLKTWLNRKTDVSSELATHDPLDQPVMDFNIDWAGLNERDVTSVSSDGTFLYVCGGDVYAKVGTGLNLSEAGKVYNHCAGVGMSRMLVSSGRLLVYRHEQQELVWYDSSNMTEVKTLRKNLRSPSPVVGSGSAWGLIGDGVRLYTIDIRPMPATPAQPENGVDPIYGLLVEIYHPRFNDDTWINAPERIVNIPFAQWMADIKEAPYCNGAELCFRINNSGTGAHFMRLSLVDNGNTAIPVERKTDSEGLKPLFRVFDAKNNLTWAIQLKGNNVTRQKFIALPNPGMYRPDVVGTDFRLNYQAKAIKALEAAAGDDMPTGEAVEAMYALLDKAVSPVSGVRYMCAADVAAFKPKAAFLWELEKETFPRLFEFIREFADAAPTESTLYKILVLLRVLRANMRQLTRARRSGKSYGMDEKLAERFVELFDRLVDYPALPDANLEQGAQLVRDDALEIISNVGFDLLFPTEAAQMTLFATLLGARDTLAKGKVLLLQGLMVNAAGKILNTMQAVANIKSTRELIFTLVDQVFMMANARCRALPTVITDLTEAKAREYLGTDLQDPLLSLLIRAQTALRSAKDDANLFSALKSEYLDKVLKYGVQLMKVLVDSPTDTLNATKEQRTLYGRIAMTAFENAFGTLIPPCVHNISSCLTQTGIAQRFAEPLCDLLLLLESFAKAFPPIDAVPTYREEVVETRHPYLDNQEIDWNVEFQGASEIRVTFDPQTVTERNCDRITIDDASGNQVANYSGPFEEFRPFTIPGSSTHIHFHSDGSNTAWGVKMTLAAHCQSSPWAVRFQKVVSFMAMRTCLALVDVPTATADKELRDWLKGPLFANGRDLTTTSTAEGDGRKLLNALMEGSGDGEKLLQALVAQRETDEIIKDNAELLLPVVRPILAGLLHHTLNVPAALKYTSGNVPVSLLAPWSGAQELAKTFFDTHVKAALKEVKETKEAEKAAKLMEDLRSKITPLREQYTKRVQFLLDVTPAAQAKTRRNYSLSLLSPRSQSPTQRWKVAAQATRAISRFQSWKDSMASGGRTDMPNEEEETRKEIVKTMGGFLTVGDLDLEKLLKAIVAHTDNAKLRIKGFELLARVLGSFPSQHTTSEALYSLQRCLSREYGHLGGTEGVAVKIVDDIKASYFRLYTLMAQTLSAQVRTAMEAGNDVPAQIFLFLNALNYDLSDTQDRNHVAQTSVIGRLLSVLSNVRITADGRKLHGAALMLLTSLSVQCCQDNMDESEQEMIDRSCAILDQYVNELNEILKTKAEPETPTGLRAVFSRYTVDLLSVFLASFRSAPLAVRNAYATNETADAKVQTFVSILLRTESTRVAAFALHVLRAVVPLRFTDKLDISVRGQAMPFSAFLMQFISSCVAYTLHGGLAGSNRLLSGTKVLPLCGARNAESLGADAVMIFRAMQKADVFKPQTTRLLKAQLEQFPSLSSYFRDNWATTVSNVWTMDELNLFCGVSAALAICGGTEDIVRAGTVCTMLEGAAAEVIVLSKLSSGNMAVVKDKASTSVNASKLVVQPAVAPSLEVFGAITLDQVNEFFNVPSSARGGSRGPMQDKVLATAYAQLRARSTRLAEVLFTANPRLCTDLINSGVVPDLLQSVLDAGMRTERSVRRMVHRKQMGEFRLASTTSTEATTGVPAALHPRYCALGQGLLSFSSRAAFDNTDTGVAHVLVATGTPLVTGTVVFPYTMPDVQKYLTVKTTLPPAATAGAVIAAAEPEGPPPGQWACAACTFFNEADARQCVMCESARTEEAAPPRAPTPPVVADAPTPAPAADGKEPPLPNILEAMGHLGATKTIDAARVRGQVVAVVIPGAMSLGEVPNALAAFYTAVVEAGATAVLVCNLYAEKSASEAANGLSELAKQGKLNMSGGVPLAIFTDKEANDGTVSAVADYQLGAALCALPNNKHRADNINGALSSSKRDLSMAYTVLESVLDATKDKGAAPSISSPFVPAPENVVFHFSGTVSSKDAHFEDFHIDFMSSEGTVMRIGANKASNATVNAYSVLGGTKSDPQSNGAKITEGGVSIDWLITVDANNFTLIEKGLKTLQFTRKDNKSPLTQVSFPPSLTMRLSEPSTQVPMHPHPLFLRDHLYNGQSSRYNCDICRASGTGPRYRCQFCATFDGCINCFETSKSAVNRKDENTDVLVPPLPTNDVPAVTDEGAASFSGENAAQAVIADAEADERDAADVLANVDLYSNLVVPENLDELVVGLCDRVADWSRQAVLIATVANMRDGGDLDISRIGRPNDFAAFVMAHARNTQPGLYFSTAKTHPLAPFLLATNKILANPKEKDAATQIFQTLLNKAVSYFSGKNSQRLAGLIITREVLTMNIERLGAGAKVLHQALIACLWNTSPAPKRELLFITLHGLLSHFARTLRQDPTPATLNLLPDVNTFSVYKALQKHLANAAKPDEAMATTYVQGLVELLLAAKRLEDSITKIAVSTQAAPALVKAKKVQIDVNSTSNLAINDLELRAKNDTGGSARVSQALQPLPDSKFAYFEVTVVAGGELAIGLTSQAIKAELVGSYENSIGYQSDGTVNRNGASVFQVARIAPGDCIGIGTNVEENRVFFVRNGRPVQGTEFDVKRNLFPVVTLKKEGAKVVFNFGQSKFQYDPRGALRPVMDKVLGPFWDRLLTLDSLADALLESNLSRIEESTLLQIFNPEFTATKVIETPHNYNNNMDEHYEFVCPGATTITLTFDPRCHTENNYDYLEIYGGPSKSNKLHGPLTGPRRDNSGNWPETLTIQGSRVYFFFHSDGSNNEWGIHVTCRANMPAEASTQTKLTAPEILSKFEGWSLATDVDLVQTVNRAADKQRSEVPWGDGEVDALVLRTVGPVREPVVKVRLPILHAYNETLKSVLGFLNLNLGSENASTLVARVCRLRDLIYSPTKTKFFYDMLRATNSQQEKTEITVSRVRAAKATRMRVIENTLFDQIMQQLKTRASPWPTALRHPEQAWKTSFIGEQSVDAGGPYRETITQMAVELQAAGHLFQLCPNGRSGEDKNTETVVPIPQFNSPQHLEWYRFVGILIGITLRTKGMFEINFPSFVWKQILGRPTTLADLEAIDGATVRALNSIRTIDEQGITAESFGTMFFETFTTFLSDGSKVELCPGGESKPLTYANRHEYCALVEAKHMHAYDLQLSKVREGLQLMIPTMVLDALLTTEEIEMLVCGKPTLDLELLKSQTEYDGNSESDAHIQMLWQCLASFDAHEASAFLRFVWGRSRLPLNAAGFSRKFKISNCSKPDPDRHLPESHTCFFQIDLPRYTTIEIMRERILYACINCTSIDNDNVQADRSEFSLFD